MKLLRGVSVVILTVFFSSVALEARVVRVRHTARRTTVTVHTGFPIHRTLPTVYVRPPAVAVRVTPVVYLPAVTFRPVVYTATVAPEARVWRDEQELDREDGWTEFTLNVDRRGKKLLLDIDGGNAQISFAEVVFDNGETQVVDFADGVQARGTFTLLDFKDGRQVDHVRMVAKASRDDTVIAVQLLV